MGDKFWEMGKYEQESVLVEEIREAFGFRYGGIYFDGTVGEGGHAKAYMDELGKGGLMVLLDRDKEVLDICRERLRGSGGCGIVMRCGHFKEASYVVGDLGLGGVDWVLYDLGISRYHLKSGRGFSFEDMGSMDMRLDGEGLEGGGVRVVNSYSEKRLSEIIFRYGEERNADRIARGVIEARVKKGVTGIETSYELKKIIEEIFGYERRRGQKIHVATKVFQALRLYINGDLEDLELGLREGVKILNCGGKFGVISFHSLEDRIVKRTFKDLEGLGEVKILTKKVIRPGWEEVLRNRSSRSAKLRVVQKR